MQDTQELMNKARELGQAIAQHDLIEAYFAAQQAVANDQEAQGLLKSYTQQMEHFQQLEAAQQPIEVADKKKMAELESNVAANEHLKDLMRSQADYVALMNQINNAMSAPLTTKAQSGKPA